MLQCDGGDPTVTDEPPTTTDEPSVTTDAPDNTTQKPEPPPPPGGGCAACPGGGTPALSMDDGLVQMKCGDKVLCQGSCQDSEGNSNTNNAKVKFIFSNLHLINCIFLNITFFQCVDKPEGKGCALQCDGSNPSVTDPPETTKITETTEKPEPPPSVDCNCPRSNPTRQNVKDENDNHVISCDGIKICEGICRQPNMNKINVSLQLLII